MLEWLLIPYQLNKGLRVRACSAAAEGVAHGSNGMLHPGLPRAQDDHLHLLGSRAHRHALVPCAVQLRNIPLCIMEQVDSETVLQDP